MSESYLHKHLKRLGARARSKKKPLMFGFITDTDNPLGGECYGCEYCCINSIKGMKYRFKHLLEKYTGKYKLYEHILDKRYKDGSFVFFCNCIDYLHEDVPEYMILRIFEWVAKNVSLNNVKFLSLTKNPERYFHFKFSLPMMYLGCTIESNRDYPLYSKAPLQHKRLGYMRRLAVDPNFNYFPRMVSIEPVLKFDLRVFVYELELINPEFVVIGYDNHNHKLREPSLANTEILIKELEAKGIKVIRKTIRKAWWEK